MAGQGLGCSGPSQQLDIWVLSERRRGWENKKKKKDQIKETDGGERTRDRVRQSDKGEEDRTGQAGLFCYETLTWKWNSARAGETSEKLDSTQ